MVSGSILGWDYLTMGFWGQFDLEMSSAGGSIWRCPQIEETSRPTICCPIFGKDVSRKVADYVDGRVLHSEPVKPSTNRFYTCLMKRGNMASRGNRHGNGKRPPVFSSPPVEPPRTVAEESPNQDSWCMLKTDDFSIYGVFDGHGQKGALPRTEINAMGHDFSGEKGCFWRMWLLYVPKGGIHRYATVCRFFIIAKKSLNRFNFVNQQSLSSGIGFCQSLTFFWQDSIISQPRTEVMTCPTL
jgi:hypothetical protein